MARNPNKPRYKPKCVVAVIVRTGDGILLTKTLGQPLQLPSAVKDRKEAASEAAYRVLRTQACLPRPAHLRVVRLTQSKRHARCYETSYPAEVIRDALCVAAPGGRDNTIAPLQFIVRHRHGILSHHYALLDKLGYLDRARTG